MTKTLLVIVGPNGVGKSTTAKMLVELCPKCAYVDSDWCRVMNPFSFTEATKRTVTENMYSLLRNYILCDDVNTVVFVYSWHGDRKEIYEKVMQKLKSDALDFEEKVIILKCSLEENITRATRDGRDETRIKRGIENTFSFYDNFSYPCIETTELTPEQVARKILKIINAD